MKTQVGRYRAAGLRAALATTVVLGLAAAGTKVMPQLGPATSRAAGPYNWLQFNDDATHSGAHSGTNALETTLTAANVGGLTQVFRVPIATNIDGTLVYLHGATVGSTSRDLLFGNEKDGLFVVFDANSGALLYSTRFVTPNTCFHGGSQPCHTTSTPAIDPNVQYVYVYGLDGYVHKIHIGDWAEVSGGGWPELATRKPQDEKGSSALSLARTNGGQTYLYVSSGGYPGDSGDYQGHVTAINLADGSQRVFNALCSNTLSAGTPPHLDYRNNTPPGASSCGHNQSAVWGRPGVVYDPDTDKIYFTTGNGDCVPTSFSWGDSVLALKPDGSGEVANSRPDGNPIDSYTAPSGPASVDGSCANLQSRDADLGSTSPAILPVAAGLNSEYAHIAVQGGKDSKLRLLNLDNLSDQGGPGHFGGEFGLINVPQGGQVLSQPAVWVQPDTGTTWVFVATSGGIAAFTLSTAGQPIRADGKQIPNLSKVWQSSAGGFSPLIANGVLYYAGNGSQHALHALNPVSGNELWKDTTVGNIHWESPLVANGVLYITDGTGDHHDAGETAGSLTAYSIAGQGNTATPTATSTSIGSRTGTNTPVPPTLTGTSTNTVTTTPVPATATSTATKTPVPATATASATSTRVPPTATSTATNTSARPTSTPRPTRTPRPTATATQTPVPPGPGVYETESLTATHSPGIAFRIINERRCSGGHCTILDATAAGQSVSFTVPVPASGIYDVQVGVKKFPTRGIFQLSVGGGNVGVSEDLYAPSEQYLMLDLGTATLLSGNTVFSFTVIGHNAASQGYKLGLDYIRLVPRS